MKYNLLIASFACVTTAWSWNKQQDRVFDDSLRNLLKMIRDCIDNNAYGLIEALGRSRSDAEDNTILAAFHQNVLQGVKRRLDYFNGYIDDIHHNRLNNLPRDFFIGYTHFIKRNYNTAIVEPAPMPRGYHSWSQSQIDVFYSRLDELIVMIRESFLAKMDNLVPKLEDARSEGEKKALIEGCNQSIFTAISTRLEYFNTYVKAIHRNDFRGLPNFPRGYANFAAGRADREDSRNNIMSNADRERRALTARAAHHLRRTAQNRMMPIPVPLMLTTAVLLLVLFVISMNFL